MTWTAADITTPPPHDTVLILTADGKYRVGFYGPKFLGTGAWRELSSHNSPPCLLSVAFWAEIKPPANEPQP